ncbi:flagellar basal body P-ring formation chaperone FlgA [Ferrimonas marina]|nr:flagellar basal body P-ring formation chaperone FlgA [Ferrimonas marina]
MKFPLLFLAFFAAYSAQAQELTPLSEIQQTAEEYVAAFTEAPGDARVEIRANPLDKRLRFERCQLPLVANAPGNSGSGRYVTVQVACPDPDGWSLYVPVQTQIQYPVVVITAALAGESLLSDDLLTVEFRDSQTLRGNHFTDPHELQGARLIRRLGAGQPVRRNNVCQVCRGDMVTILARVGGMEIKTSGEALGSGAVGDTIRVKNNRSERMIDARVVAVGTVEVRM